MSTKKIIIAGASGSLGTMLLNKKIKGLKYFSLSFQNNDQKHIKCDLTKKNNTFSLLNKIKPDIIINSAALIDINYCEKNPKKSYEINFNITKNLTDWILEYSTKTNLIFISSDQVYGLKESLNTENDFKFVNIYGKHKIMSEKYLQKLQNYLILRVNFVGKGISNNSFTDWVITSFKKNKKFSLYGNVFFNPVTTSQLANIINSLIKKDIKGIFNIGSNLNNKKISKADFAIGFAKKSKIYNDNYEIINYYNDKIKRPLNMTMNINKIQKIIPMPKLNHVIKDLVKEYDQSI